MGPYETSHSYWGGHRSGPSFSGSPWSWDRANHKLKYRESIIIENKTKLVRQDDGSIAVRFFSTDIVTIHHNNTFTINAGGWGSSLLTRERIEAYAPVRLWWDKEDGLSLLRTVKTPRVDGDPIRELCEAMNSRNLLPWFIRWSKATGAKLQRTVSEPKRTQKQLSFPFDIPLVMHGPTRSPRTVWMNSVLKRAWARSQDVIAMIQLCIAIGHRPLIAKRLARKIRYVQPVTPTMIRRLITVPPLRDIVTPNTVDLRDEMTIHIQFGGNTITVDSDGMPLQLRGLTS